MPLPDQLAQDSCAREFDQVLVHLEPILMKAIFNSSPRKLLRSVSNCVSCVLDKSHNLRLDGLSPDECFPSADEPDR